MARVECSTDRFQAWAKFTEEIPIGSHVERTDYWMSGKTGPGRIYNDVNDLMVPVFLDGTGRLVFWPMSRVRKKECATNQ